MVKPLYIDSLAVPKQFLADVETLAGIDRGCSLTKVLYLPKSDDNDTINYNFHAATFHNTDFELSIDWLTENGQLPTSGKLHVTGVGCDRYRNLIMEKTKLEVFFVDEMNTVSKGSQFLLNYLSIEEICCPPIKQTFLKPVNTKLDGLMLELVNSLMKGLEDIPESTDSDQKNLPAILGHLGSATGFMELDNEDEATMLGGTIITGKTLLGLGKVLLGTSDYTEIVKLAEKGDLNKLNLTIGANHVNKEGSQYGVMDPNLPLIPLGNVKPGTTLSDYKKEDVAIGMLDFIVTNVYTFLLHAAIAKQMTKVFIGGNMSRSTLIQEMFQQCNSVYSKGLIKIHFLKTGHTGALGAMLTKPSDVREDEDD